ACPRSLAMRRVLVSLLAILSCVPGLSARDKSDWANVQKLKPGTPVAILLSAGEELRGYLEAADASGLRLTWLDRNGTLIASSHRSEEHTSELQSLAYLVCRLLLEKKKKSNNNIRNHTSAQHT